MARKKKKKNKNKKNQKPRISNSTRPPKVETPKTVYDRKKEKFKKNFNLDLILLPLRDSGSTKNRIFIKESLYLTR